jgi:ABC-type nitrate/sulfonate/bicarbonate transport system substrate-binding protein
MTRPRSGRRRPGRPGPPQPLGHLGRLRRVGALSIALVLPLGAACGSETSTSDADDPRAVTLMLNWTPNAHHVGIYAAEARGWFTEAGIDLTIVEPVATGVEQAVAAGAADIGIAQAESLLPARAAGVPVTSVATLLPVNDSALFSLAEDQITRPRDLEGTRYGGFGGALETEIIAALVRCDGGDPGAVEDVTIGNVDYVVGMQQDAFDSAWVFSGWDALRAELGAGVDVDQIRFADYADCIPNWYTPLLLTTDEAARSDLTRTLLDTMARGYALAAQQPQAAAADMAQEVPEIDETLLEASADYYADRFTREGQPWGWQRAEDWEGFTDFLLDGGILSDPVDPASAFTNDSLPDGGP